ncbi:amino acid deaminase/aldolase [Crossiella cryophila]|uniref:D-serine deaminase-like pyridoxal phosphate-dependent protein n=1 Tax=Crossiella cryophila TaxID=43355 RepID=A0A7W7FRJ7_9PSEU|nr:amino acid deaminase/aldolase [Crossiella cryophila]MBB4675005.1 D-serine deaminase-like pyridoxal phosphate-dependent protein [Crossiella cryophila]
MLATQTRSRFDAATAHLDPPLAAVDLAAFHSNAAELVRRAHGRPIRLASKSVRVRELLKLALADPGFAGLMCYSLNEALWLHGAGVSDDLLIGYPTVDRAALQKLAADDGARAAITLMIDDPAHLDLITEVLGPGHPEIRVCLELDASWRPLSGAVHVGVRRSPVHTPAQARSLAVEVVRRPGFALVGIMSYEAQVAGLGDKPIGRPVRGLAVRWMQKQSLAELAERRALAVAGVRSVAELEFVNGGGTGSLERTAAEDAVTELTAGSGLLAPTLFDNYEHLHLRPAALFALPVVRRPTRDTATVFAGGYLASGPVGPDRVPVPYLPRGLKLNAMEGAGEVQTPLVGKAADGLAIGDRVWFRHAKAGELAERFTEFHLIDGDQVSLSAPTYRGEGRAFG